MDFSVKKSNKVTDSTSIGTFERSELNNLESTSIDCQTNLKDIRFTGTTGKMFRIKCPNCMTEKFLIFGTEIYHPLSSICKAATHSGALKKNKGGIVIVEILNGARAYNGSPGADRTNSATFGGADKSFRVTKAPKLTRISCSTKANENKIGTSPLNMKIVVLCPKKCSKMNEDIFGDKIYSDDSSICLAAIHYGMISDLGGEVRMTINI